MKIEKAFAISNAKISFVSLVNKAANKRRFLITKEDGDMASFTSCGKIVKADAENHYVTGVVYEPMAEDTDGNFMTEDEITKAAYWYNKNSDKVDIQHSFKPTDGASVVESWIAKADFDIDGQHIKRGTWLMTMEVTDGDLWKDICKGAITGFSMGGVGEYSNVDEDIKSLAKSDDDTEAKSLFARLGRALGLSVVEKGRVTDEYKRQAKSSAFWAAFDSLKAALNFCGNDYETDEAKIRAALQEFNDIIVDLLNNPDPVFKSIKPRQESAPETKSEKDIPEGELNTDENKDPEKEETSSEQNNPEEDEKDNDKEENTVTKAEIEQIATAVAKLVNPETEKDVAKAAEAEENANITEEAIQQMVDQAVAKAMQPEKPAVTANEVQTMIDTAVEKAVSAVMKSRNTPSNLNGNSAGNAEPAEHYMHGIL